MEKSKLLKDRDRVNNLLSKISVNLFGIDFLVVAKQDEIYKVEVEGETFGRLYLQCYYDSECTLTGEVKTWSGRKWYLSEFMTDDEIIKTAWCSFEAAVKHEVMEAFKVEGLRLFNPHTPYLSLLTVSDIEIKRS